MKNSKWLTRKKKGSAAVSALLAGVLFVSGSLAFKDFNQHKTNEFNTASVQDNVVLIEDFQEKDNWKKDEIVKKKVTVKNGQDTDDTVNYTYEDAYIRLNFKEYMEIGSQKYDYTDERFMINTAGEFERFTTQALAEAFVATLPAPNNSTAKVMGVKAFTDNVEHFYIHTEAKDANGQYGKHIATGVQIEAAESIVPGVVRASDDAINKHDQKAPNGEDDYTVHQWDATTQNKASVFTDYVKFILGTDVMTMADWIAAGKNPVAKWIIDETSPEGWVYWGIKLTHGQETSAILENVELVKQPEGAAYYAIHTHMEAVSLDRMYEWVGASEDIVGALGGSTTNPALGDKTALIAAIAKAELPATINGMTPASIAKLSTALNSARLVNADDKATVSQVNSAEKALSDAIANLITIPNKAALEAAIAKAELPATIQGKTTASKTALKNVLTSAKAINTSNGSTQAQVNVEVTKLNNAIAALEDVIKMTGDGEKGSKITDFAGRDWIVQHKDAQGNLLIVAEKQLSMDDFAKYGITSDHATVSAVTYYEGASNATLYTGYASSKVRDSLLKMYMSEINSTDYFEYLVTVDESKTQEPVSADSRLKYKTETAYPSAAVSGGGSVRPFILSVSDLNVYDIDRSIFLGQSGYSWIRSTGFEERQVMAIGENGLGSRNVSAAASIQPALWINPNK